MIKLYKLLTFLLQPIGYILLVSSISSLLAISINPQFLLASAVGICVLIYLFLCFRFTLKTIVSKQSLKPKLKDWIKVNSYVTLLQAVLMFFVIVMVLFFIPKEQFDSTFKAMYDMLQNESGQQNIGSMSQFLQSIRTMFGIMGVIELVLIIHVVMTWKLLKKYSEYFKEA